MKLTVHGIDTDNFSYVLHFFTLKGVRNTYCPASCLDFVHVNPRIQNRAQFHGGAKQKILPGKITCLAKLSREPLSADKQCIAFWLVTLVC